MKRKERATKLSKALSKKGKSLLILDGLHSYFSMEMVGIPNKESGCKLILTTQWYNVCQEMGCEEAIEVTPLTHEEAFKLFVMKLGLEAEFPSELESIARSIVGGCARLPLVIITLAGSMKGVNDVVEWQKARDDFKKSRDEPKQERRKHRFPHKDPEPDILSTFLWCYNRLHGHGLKQCLLYCALFPNDFKIKREDLIEYMIVEGIIAEMDSRMEESLVGHHMLDELESVYLLGGFRDSGNQNYVRMHDVVRDMALQVMKDSKGSQALVDADVQLNRMPQSLWRKDLARVSLMKNRIDTHYCGPVRSKISTLLLCKNRTLKEIPDSFFKYLPLLRVLDLSATSVEVLPSLSDLVLLTALFLKRCKQLRHLPSLANLRKLSSLDVRYTAIEEVPHGLEFLCNLKYLNLHETRLRNFPHGLLPNLSLLRFLKISQTRDACPVVSGDEVAGLRRLETLRCHLNDLLEFNKLLKSWEGAMPINNYNLLVGCTEEGCNNDLWDDLMAYYHCQGSSEEFGRQVWLYNCSIRNGGKFVGLPKGIQRVVFAKCNDATSLCNVDALQSVTQLKSMEIWECDGMEYLLSLPKSTFRSLEVLRLQSLNRLRFLFARELDLSPIAYRLYGGVFSSLKTFIMRRCPTVTKLFSTALLRNLQNLEVIEVEHCSLMEEIIAPDPMVTTLDVSLPKLRILKLRKLPQLKSICSRKLLSNQLHEIHIIDCLKLERVPFFEVQDNAPAPASLGRIQVFPEEWWELMEWVNPNTKKALQHLCVFDDSDLFIQDEQNQSVP